MESYLRLCGDPFRLSLVNDVSQESLKSKIVATQ